MFKRIVVSKKHSVVRGSFLFLLSNTFLILGILLIIEMALIGLSLSGVTISFPSSVFPILRRICFF